MPSFSNLAKRHMAAQDCRLVGRLARRHGARRLTDPHAAAAADEELYAGRPWRHRIAREKPVPQLVWARLG